ncbi:two-component system sensor histidine kinase TcrY [Microbacterium sediminicola]|uniref:histidine kinase n=1 Tax=Microbacterium sediminicola TaxID=415210 RepID=A0ABN2I361_9MICO
MTSAPAAETAQRSTPGPRRRWSLQARLIVTVVGIVSLILILISVASGALLRNILEDNLDAKLRDAVQSVRIMPGASAVETLDAGRQPVGFLWVMQSSGELTGAYVSDDEEVVALTSTQLSQLAASIGEPGWTTVTIDGLGTYRVAFAGDLGGVFGIAGLPVSEVTETVTQILTTVALVTAGGLIILGLVVTLIIRSSLRPLQAVADTAERVASIPLAEGTVKISDRVPDSLTDEHSEVGRVGHALNTLLDHVDVSLDARQRNEERMRRFVADASHELRTPLASIRGYSELSLRDPSLSENTGSALERIQAQSLRMTSLVEDLLLLARLDEGQELVYGTVDLTQMAYEAVADANAAGRDHVWQVEVDDEPVVIPGDARRIQQVVINMLANARTHTPEGTEVTLSVTHDAENAIIRVHDNGPGIDPAISAELFERFSRADRSRARQTGGTGLGLSIARAIVHAHHGEITVDSVPGDTTFTVRFPLRTEAPEPGQ